MLIYYRVNSAFSFIFASSRLRAANFGLVVVHQVKQAMYG
jgi:hypothetical protein